jgi:hypothetical protein
MVLGADEKLEDSEQETSSEIRLTHAYSFLVTAVSDEVDFRSTLELKCAGDRTRTLGT